MFPPAPHSFSIVYFYKNAGAFLNLIPGNFIDQIDGTWGEIPYATRDAIGRTVDYSAGRNRYIGHLIAMATRSFKDKRVGLDRKSVV